MTQSNVRAFSPPVNPSVAGVEEVCSWTNLKAERGEIALNSGRLRVTALRALASVLGPEEPRDVQSILDDLPNITRRWATLNSATKSDTARTYESRAKSAIEDYLGWAKDPTGFKFSRREPALRGEALADKKASRKPVPPATTAAAAGQPTPPATVSPPFLPEQRDFPLGEDRGAFTFTLPPGGITFVDVRKIAVHLFTLSKDFNIADENQARIFQMVVRGDNS